MTTRASGTASSTGWDPAQRWLTALVLALLISHELDAMVRAEWDLLPGFGGLADDTARDVFNLLHVPIFVALLGALTSPSPAVRLRTALGIDVFVVGHAIAHTALRSADDYRFEGVVEVVTVHGAALVAAVHLAWWWRAGR